MELLVKLPPVAVLPIARVPAVMAASIVEGTLKVPEAPATPTV